MRCRPQCGMVATVGRRCNRRANIHPVFEGWLPNPDGSFELLFGT
jgi:hypothetical protein